MTMHPKASHPAVIAGVGLAASAGAFLLSDMLTGILGAALFMVGLVLAPVAVGAAVGRSAIRSPPASLRRFGKLTVAEIARCGGCGDERSLQRQVFVCATCDFAVASD